MKVSELITELQNYPQDAEVVTDRVREIPDGYYKANLVLYYEDANILVVNHKPSFSWHDPDIYRANHDAKNEDTPKLPFKIISIFKPSERLDELDEIPKTEAGCTDYWAAAQQLCAKDGGRLPTMKELAQLASYIYGQEIGAREDKFGVEVKNHIEGLDPSEGTFYLWSSSPTGSEYAYHRGYGSSGTGYYRYYRNGGGNRDYDDRRVVCLGDE